MLIANKFVCTFIGIIFLYSGSTQAYDQDLQGRWVFQKLICRQQVTGTNQFSFFEKSFPFASPTFIPQVELEFSSSESQGPDILEKKVMQRSCPNLTKSAHFAPDSTLQSSTNRISLTPISAPEFGIMDPQVKVYKATGRLLQQNIDYKALLKCGGVFSGLVRALGAFVAYSPYLGNQFQVEAEKEYILYVSPQALVLEYNDSNLCPGPGEKTLMSYTR